MSAGPGAELLRRQLIELSRNAPEGVSVGLGEDENIYKIVWNYVVQLVNSIDLDKSSVENMKKSLDDFFKNKSYILKFKKNYQIIIL